MKDCKWLGQEMARRRGKGGMWTMEEEEQGGEKQEAEPEEEEAEEMWTLEEVEPERDNDLERDSDLECGICGVDFGCGVCGGDHRRTVLGIPKEDEDSGGEWEALHEVENYGGLNLVEEREMAVVSESGDKEWDTVRMMMDSGGSCHISGEGRTTPSEG